MTDSNIRLSGPRFRRLIFIALGAGGPNLPMRGVVYDDDDDLDHDLLSDNDSEMSVDSDGDESSTPVPPSPLICLCLISFRSAGRHDE